MTSRPRWLVGSRLLALLSGAVLAGGAAGAPNASSPPQEQAVSSVFAEFVKPGQPGCSVGVRRKCGNIILL